MADKDLFSRLKRLFSTNTIVRNIGGKRLKIVDTGQLQSNVQTNLVDRYSKLYSNMQQYGYNDQLYQQQLRLGLFRDYESMDSDSIIASALDIYSDESTGLLCYFRRDSGNSRHFVAEGPDFIGF